jgi:pyridoxamine 5'-phosphate oxidase
MIAFKNISQEPPYSIFKEKYDEAMDAGQKNIEAINISSYRKEKEEVDSRYVNLKIIDGNEFIFFTNYNSPKSLAFSSHNQISALLFWPSINAQIRIKAKIKKTSKEFNQLYFTARSSKKNALAISSNQSNQIDSYDSVKKKYKYSLEFENLLKCPDFWGGYSFSPYYFEFWEGHNLRLNKRDAYKKNGNNWEHYVLQP